MIAYLVVDFFACLNGLALTSFAMNFRLCSSEYNSPFTQWGYLSAMSQSALY